MTTTGIVHHMIVSSRIRTPLRDEADHHRSATDPNFAVVPAALGSWPQSTPQGYGGD